MFTTDLVNLYNKNIFKISLYIYICQDEKCRLMRNLSLSMDVTHVSTSIFQGLFNNIVFRSVALVKKGYLDFSLHRLDFLPPCTLPYALKKITKIF